MGSNIFVEPNHESASRALSHHEAVTLAQTETRREQNEGTCRGVSSLLSSQRLQRFGSCFRTFLSLFAVLFLWSSIIRTAHATDVDHPAFLAIQVEDDLGWKGSALYIDHRPPPEVPPLMPPLRNDGGPINTAVAQLAKRVVKSSEFAVPQPFDAGLSNNFTSNCASFLLRLRANEDFKNCHPFSLMLQVR